MSAVNNPDTVRDAVREGYAKIARDEGGCCAGTSCCGTSSVSAQIGYDPSELGSLPEGADMGLSCGNPGAIASLMPGETVIDLGSGGGLDIFLAGPKVGPTGRAIGIDMTPDMLSKARAGVASYRQRTGLDNVEFRLGEIEHIPVADATADCVISNCVLNLSPDKPRVWCEIARVLKPGGRAAISDMALLRPLPEDVAGMIDSLIGCISGAVTVDETRAMIEASGLEVVELTPKGEYMKALEQSRDPLYHKIASMLPEGTSPADFVTSLDIKARKPA
ncbi:MAG: methyltransferase domain-containing protein [Phycisphaerales bacterium]|nr:MAG: methyltransferase domain-containing protein [Phycisphaerales bacterium]